MSATNSLTGISLKESDLHCQFVAGAVGGIAGLAIGHPMDTIKTLLQNSHQKSSAMGAINTVRVGGVAPFFRGISLPIFSYAFVNAVTFAAYKGAVGQLDPTETDALSTAISGAAAGFVQLGPSIPVEVVKIHQQVEAGLCPTKQGQTVVECLRSLFKLRGVRALYAGGLIQAARDVPAFAAYFFTYTQSLKVGEKYGLDPMLNSLYSGGFGGAVSWAISLPMDVLKTRMQSGSSDMTLRQAYFDLVKNEGYSALFRGFNVVVSRALIVNAAIFVVYEESYKWLNSMRIQK